MGRITLLPKSVYKIIAAAEAIVRPLSVVKELIENSLDAGATEIEIYIEDGGLQLIKVVDNGSGMDRDDLDLAFVSHATSKIAQVSDLDNLLTLGFRGEALASIAVISKAEIISVVKNSPAYKITCLGGELGKTERAALDCGTVVNVYDLFYNAPARKGFLKTQKSEELEIATLVNHFILGKPNISFKLYIDGKLKQQSYGGGLEEAFTQVYGGYAISKCFNINTEVNGIKIIGYISDQSYTKYNRSYQTIFVNGRLINNEKLTQAVFMAYKPYLMNRQYPLYMLDISMPLYMVDFNRNSDKTIVSFSDSGKLFSTLNKVVSNILDGTAVAANFVTNQGELPQNEPTIIDSEFKPYSENKMFENGNNNSENTSVPQTYYNEAKFRNTIKCDNEITSGSIDATELSGAKVYNFSAFFKANGVTDSFKPQSTNKYHDPQLDEQPYNFFESQTLSCSTDKYDRNNMAFQEHIDFRCCIYRGTIFNTYLIFEINDKAFLVDQHAAHERIIFDKLTKQVEEKSVKRQQILNKYIFEVTPDEKKFIESNISLINKVGFRIQQSAIENKMEVSEIPVGVEYSYISEFFEDLLASKNDLGVNLCVADILKEKLASIACKSAIKAGKELTSDEINELFKLLNGNSGLKCPHGRPICVSLTKRDIDKMFKRIV